MIIDPGIIIAVIALAGSVLSAVLQYRRGAGSHARSIAAGAAELIEPYREELERLRNIVDELQQRIINLEEDNRQLRNRVSHLERENGRLLAENERLRREG